MTEEQGIPLLIHFDEYTPFEKMLRIFLAYNEIYHERSGDVLKIVISQSLDQISKPESEYEVNPDSPFANTTKKLEPSLVGPYISRDDVYGAIQKYAKQERAQHVREALDIKFSFKTWEWELPLLGAYEFLVNEHLDDLVLRM